MKKTQNKIRKLLPGLILALMTNVSLAAVDKGPVDQAPGALAPYLENNPEQSVASPTSTALTTPSTPGSFNLTLADIGHRQGHFFEGAYGMHSKDFFFPLPRGATLLQGSLRVHFRASPLLNAASSLRFAINGKPSRLLSLENREQATFIDIPLDQEAMQRDALQLTVKAVLSHGENRCFDERRLALHFVQILPQTAVAIALDPATNLAAAWTSLPAQVKVGSRKPTARR